MKKWLILALLLILPVTGHAAIYAVNSKGVVTTIPNIADAFAANSYAGSEIHLTSSYDIPNIAVTDRTLVMDRGAIGTTSSSTKTIACPVVMNTGSTFTLTTDLVLSGSFTASLDRHFSGAGLVTMPARSISYPEWFYDGSDLGLAINRAMYSITSGIVDSRNIKGSHAVTTLITVSNNMKLLFGSCILTFPTSPGINNTGGSLTIEGAGVDNTIFRSTANSHLIIAVPSTASTLSVKDITLFDTLTTTGSTFAQWSTTRTVGSAIHISPSAGHVILENIQTTGFVDGINMSMVVASTFNNVRCNWAGQDSFSITGGSTSLTFNSCYSFAPQRDGFHAIGNVIYCTLNACASDNAGVNGYYFGPQTDAGLPTYTISPSNIVLNSCGSEQAGSKTPYAGAGIKLDGVRGITLNDFFATGFGTAVVNTSSGLVTAKTYDYCGAILLNGGSFGTVGGSQYFGEYGIKIPTGTTTGRNSITNIKPYVEAYGALPVTVNSASVLDPDGAIKPATERVGTKTITLLPTGDDYTTPVTATGYYTRTENLVTISVIFNNFSGAGASGNLQLSGLPFSSVTSVKNSGICGWYNGAASSLQTIATPDTGGTVFGIYTGSYAIVTAVTTTAGQYMNCQITYKTNDL